MKSLKQFIYLSAILLFVCSLIVNIRLFLDNRILTELLVTQDNGLDNAGEVRELVGDLHKIFKMKDENLSKKGFK